MEVPKSLPDFYLYAVLTVFAVVIGQSFPQAVEIFIPISNLATADGLENAFALIFAYFFIITSWIGYFMSIRNKPHTETKLGTLRFVVDLLIIYLFYFLVNLVRKKEYHGDIFQWVLPMILIVFVAWDILKYLEYRNQGEEPKGDRINRIEITLVFLAVFIVQAFIYPIALSYMKPLDYGVNVVHMLFITTSVTATLFYRYRKWRAFTRKGHFKQV